MWRKKSQKIDDDLTGIDDNLDMLFEIADILNSLIESINDNILYMVIPFVISSAFYVYRDFSYIQFKSDMKIAMKILESAQTEVEIVESLRDISNNTSMSYRYDGEKVRLYEGEFFVEITK